MFGLRGDEVGFFVVFFFTSPKQLHTFTFLMDCEDLRDGQWTIYSAPLAGSFMLLLHSQELM